MTKDASLTTNKPFIAAMENVLSRHRRQKTPVATFFGALAFLEGKGTLKGDGMDMPQVTSTAVEFIDRHYRNASAPSAIPNPTDPQAQKILSQFNDNELQAIEQTTTSKPLHRQRRNKFLQAGFVTALSAASVGFGVWRQAEHNRAAVQTAAEQTAAYRAIHPDDPITIEPQSESLCPAPYMLGGMGLLCAALLLILAHEISEGIKKTNAKSQADYEKILESAFSKAEARMREEPRRI